MHGIIAWFTRNGVAANLLMLLIVLLGINAVKNRIPLEVFPAITRDVVNIEVIYPGAPPEEVESGVIVKIEQAIANLPGIEKIFSNANEGSADIRVEVSDGENPREILNDISGRIDGIRNLPVEAERPLLSIQKSRREVISVVVSGQLDERQLRNIGGQVRDELLDEPGISQVELTGLRPFEISIEIDEDTLQKFNLTLEQVANAIRQSSRDVPAGSIKTRGGDILLRSLGQAYTGKDYRKIVIITQADGTRITLGDIATVHDGFAEDPLYAEFDGKPSAIIEVYRIGTENAIEVAAATRAYIARKAKQLPEGITISYWRDRSEVVNARLHTLTKSAMQGGLLIFILLALFLRLSVAIWVCVGIPISFMGALALMPELGVTLNLLSLFAFILVLGIVVDDAIVTGENIYSHLKNTDDPTRAAIEGTQEVATPVTFGVLTTVAAFIPLLMIDGVRGALFAQIPMIIIPVLLFSLVESKLILPAHMKHIRPEKQIGKPNAYQRFQRYFSHGLENSIIRYYSPFLDRTLKHRYLTLAVFIAVSIVVLSIVFSGRFGYTFFPRVQSETARATLIMPRGTPVEVTERHIEHIYEVAAQLQKKYIEPETGHSIIRHILVRMGHTNRGRSNSRGQSHIGQVSFQITPPEYRTLDITSSELVREWRKGIGEIPGAQEITYRAEIAHGGDPIDIQLEGQNFEELAAAGDILKQRLAEYPGVFDIHDSFEGGKQEIKLSVTPLGESLGITVTSLGQQIRNAFFGLETQRIQRGRDELKVMLRYPKEARHSLETLDSMYITTPSGDKVPFDQVARVEIGRGYATINRINRSRTLNVTADVDKQNTDVGKIIKELQTFIPEVLAQYPNLRYELEGEQREQKESTNSLKQGSILVLFLIYALLAIPFRSYVQPLIVMGIIPFSIIGAILGHMIMGMNLSIMSMMGMLALAGVVVNDSLVLVDYTNRRRREGMSLQEAIRKAGVARFRPILLTSLTTFVGLVPLIFEKSTQAQFLIPMAISLGFGILFATFLTLLLIPSSYLILEDVKALLRKLRGNQAQVI